MGDESIYVLMFGFEKKNDFHTGFLKVGKSGDKPFYTIAYDESEATRFRDASAAEFFATEPELEGWAFHPVKRRVFKGEPKDEEAVP